ncbi:uncharacterized protein LOC143192477 isoform X1 [Rhynchophorus ferrugineus]|uniref:uncharacterized protein LOC143192477 isoform X1 n=1 Tax=Rhynchophorus ferrugineus TaxID=354439 RepID=UPI003FCE2415
MLTKGWNVKRGENFFQLYLLRVCCSWLPGPERRCTSFLMKHEKNEIRAMSFTASNSLPSAEKANYQSPRKRLCTKCLSVQSAFIEHSCGTLTSRATTYSTQTHKRQQNDTKVRTLLNVPTFVRNAFGRFSLGALQHEN